MILFSPARSAITITVTGDPHPGITVTDTSVGIPDDELPHVYHRFYRGQHARQQAVPGQGLGLTIARRLATAHHGTLHLSSGPAGTTAAIGLPCSPDSERCNAGCGLITCGRC